MRMIDRSQMQQGLYTLVIDVTAIRGQNDTSVHN